MRSTILACALILLATTAAADAKTSGATIVVTKFYDWYLAHRGNVDWYAPQHGHIDWELAMRHHTEKYFQVRPLFHPNLFEELDQTYLKGIGEKEPVFYVQTTPDNAVAKLSSFDPYVGAPSPATSYQLGPSWVGQVYMGGAGGQLRAVTLVPVTFAFANTRLRTKVTVIVRMNGNSYQIYDIHYAPIQFYYSGAITDLLHFLGAYNC
ncbi:MAG: hypothetical protein WB615_11075 [Candidatus Tumulicola sp.]